MVNNFQRKNINDYFFVIDSRNLEKVESHLYGYCYEGEKIYNSNINPVVAIGEIPSQGAYVYVKNVDGKIIVQQDYVGSYGLYLFRKDEYFALSNSFLMLVDHLKDEFSLTFNEDYANAFLLSGLVSYAVEETMVQEIKMLLRNKKVVIDIKNAHLSLENIDYQEETIELDSPEGIALVDEWHAKWINLIRCLKKRTNNIVVDLSGGFDSRITLMLFLTADINMNEITINSSDDGLHVHGEDYRIASDIASEFGFALNKTTFCVENNPFQLEEKIDFSFLTKLCFHKELYFPYGYCKEPVFHFTGAGGETVRNYNDKEPEEFIIQEINCLNNYNIPEKSLSRSIRKVIENSYKKIGEMSCMPIIANRETVMRLYQESRTRNHYGRTMVEGFVGNRLQLAPSLDPILHKLKKPPKEIGRVLFAFMLKRYCEKLLKFDVEGNRSFGEETIYYADILNKKYPYKFCNLMKVGLDNRSDKRAISSQDKFYEKKTDIENPNDVLLELFQSKYFRSYFASRFSERIYQIAKEHVKRNKFVPLRHVYSLLAVTRILMDCERSNAKYKPGSYGGLVYLQGSTLNKNVIFYDYQMATLFHRISTARVDVSNKGCEENNIELNVSDKLAQVSSPTWFNKNGIGYVIMSEAKQMRLQMKCIGDGNLNIILRGIDCRDANGNKLPFYIDYTYFAVNGKVLFNDVYPVHHDSPYRFIKRVKNGEICEVKIRWEIHAYEKDMLLRLMYCEGGD